jgi:hypothetical protein
MDDAKHLYVSDDPETFKTHGKLFHAKLPDRGTVARILFDHVNGTSVPPGATGAAMRVIVAIVNTGRDAAGIAIRGNDVEPSANGMDVGHRATMEYLKAHEIDPGAGLALFTVEGGDAHVLSDHVLQPGAPGAGGHPGRTGDCTAGIFDFESQVAGAEFELRIIACDPSSDLSSFDDLPDLPTDGKQRRGIFDITGTAIPSAIAYGGGPVTIGPEHQFYPHVPGDAYDGPGHTGEYGVLKRFRCDVSGPQTGRLAQSARGAGNATATYVIEGELLQSHQFAPNPFLEVTTFDVAAGRRRTVSVVTMAEINSTLPVQLSMGPTTTQIAQAPIFRA